MKKFSEFLTLRERCWTGFKSVPGKKPYSPGSCVKESAAAAIAAATAISKKKSGNYDEKGFRKTSYKNPDHPLRKSNIERKKEVEEAKPKVVISIQERVFEKTRDYISEIEGAIDDCFVLLDFKTVFDPYDLMRSLDIKGAHTKHILPVYQKKLEEIEEAIKGKDEQLVEGYSFLSKKELKEYASLLKRIIDDCAKIAHTAKLTRAPRKKKAKPVDKIIEKLQFKKEDNEYKAASINPTDIIGASQLWVFNTKTRKLGCYNATDVGGLNIKGTTLTNFNEETSVQKTIRKPEVVLPATLKAGKVALRKVLTDINAVEQALTGRVNSDIILLRVIK